MKFSIITLLLCFFSSPLEASPLVGSGNDNCASAQLVGPGNYSGTLSDIWYYEMITHQILWNTDEDWYRISVPPGRELQVTVKIFPTSGAMGLQRTDLWSTCSGGLLASTSPAIVVNSTAVVRDYFLQLSAQSALVQTDLWASYTIEVKINPIQAGASYCPGAVNSQGVAASLLGMGSPSVSANTLSFIASHVPSNSPALLFDGTSQAQVPFGDGSLCLSGSLHRLIFQPANAVGNWSAPLDFTALMPSAAIAPGSTWNFQLFYRDLGGPLGTGFNLTNGYQITFLP